MTEHIACVSTSQFCNLGHFQGFTDAVHKYAGLFMSIGYYNRDSVEEDPAFKQLIPYIVLSRPGRQGNGWTFLKYQRGLGQAETRLHAKWSIGIGGHVNDQDAGIYDDAFMRGARRELAEEVKFGHDPDCKGIAKNPMTIKLRAVGLINDDTTPVGAVHLGVVYMCVLNGCDTVTPNEPDMDALEWVTIADLLRDIDQFESWSQFAIRHLASLES